MYREIDLPETFNLTTALLDDHLEAERGKEIAIRARKGAVSYEELFERTCQFSWALRDLGIRPEERVSLLLYDRPEFIYAFLGALRAGCQAVPLNTMLKLHDYRYLLRDSRTRVLVVEADLVEPILALRQELPWLEHVIVVGDGSDDLEGCLDFDGVLKDQPRDFVPEGTGRDEPAFWLYSSGSTGAPKGAVHLHKDAIYSADFFGHNTLGIEPSDSIFSVPALFFAYGLGNSLYIPLRLGASVVLVSDRPTPDRVFARLEEFRPTVFFSVPTGYAQLLAYAEESEREFDLSSLRICHSGGEPLPKSIHERWHDRYGVEIWDGYGSSELLHITISNYPGSVRPGSSGRVVDGYEARLVGVDGKEVPSGEVGMLEMKGGSAAAYYWGKLAKTRDAFQGWWFRTGDQYYADDDGYLWFVGRTDDMIKASGIWVSPSEVESVITELKEVLEAGVVGVPDTEGLDKPVAFVVLKSEHSRKEGAEERIREYVKSRLAPYKAPRQVTLLPELPKTASGKIQRFRLREMGRVL